MRIEDIDYPLPEELIAQYPAARRDDSRLMVLQRGRDAVAHHVFRDLPDLLRGGDLLIFNDTRVLPARLVGRRAATGGKWEGLFLQSLPDGAWEMLSQTRGRLQVGERVIVTPRQGDGEPLRLLLLEKRNGHWIARPDSDAGAGALLERYGHVPLPPYVRKGRDEDADRERYQTVYAERAGAVAAPTAGLHFTSELLDRLHADGIERSFVTLHVGIGTFRPVKEEDVERHRMHEEWYELPERTVSAIERCRSRGGRVIAVGTTTVRVLETVAAHGPLQPGTGMSDLYVYPPYDFRVIDGIGMADKRPDPTYDFRVIDGMITNFHLPRSSLLLLVGAFAGVDAMKRAYHVAVEKRYRFFSYGDAMLVT